MGGLLRKLLIYICKPIYKIIVYIYKIFYNLANTHILSQDIIQQLSSNIYVLVSVVMLFAFSITILSAIVNPDLLSDKKKGVTAIFKRSIIGLALMVIVPFGFTELYKIQESIMTNSVIEKVVVGVDFSCKDSDSDCEVGGNGGQVIAGTLISSVLYPVDDEVKIAANVSESYENMVASDISYIGDIAKNINVTREGDSDESFHLKFDDEDYAFNFDGLLAILVGGATVYILVLFAMDIAVRIFKLAFLELTAPISIVGYIAAGDKILSSWFKELISTYMSLFIRIASMAFYLFLISNLSTFTDDFGDNDWTFVFKAFLVVGMLIFVKQLPDMINKVFGTNMKTSGGIGGRLGEMALVGKQAQKAWGAVKNVAGLGAAGLGLGAAALTPIGAGAIAGGIAGKKLWDNKLKDTKFGRGATAVGKTAGTFLGGKSTIDGLKSGRKTWNETGFGTDRKYNKDRKEDNKFNEKIGLDEYGRVKSGELSSTIDNFNRNIQKDVGRNNAEKINQLHKANVAKSEIEAISGKSKDVVDKLESMKLSARTTDGKQELASLQEDFQAGNLSVSQLRSRLKDLYSKGEIQASSIKKVSTDIDSLEGVITKSSNSKINGLLDQSGELKMNKVSGISKEFTENYDFAKKDYDNVYKNQSETVKADMDRYVAASTAIVKSTVDSNKKSVNNTTAGQKYIDQINATQVVIKPNAQNSSNSQTSSSYSNTTKTNNSSANGGNSDGLNIDLSTTAPEPLKPDDYNISSSGGLHLNQEEVEKQKREDNIKQSIDQMERMFAPSNEDSDKPKFKLKDDE